jgi:hypothetical protein
MRLAGRACVTMVVQMPPRDRKLLLGLAAITLALASLTLVGVHSDVLLAAPVLVFALPLLAGRYVGEEQLARLAAAYLGARRRPAATIASHARRTARRLPRGGRLIAAALAVRPPPPEARLIA